METRYQPGQPIELNLLNSRELLRGSIVQFGGPLAKIKFDRPLPAQAPVRIDFEDSVLMGEVSSLEPCLDGHIVTVAMRDAIPVMSDLARLVTAVLSGGKSVVPSLPHSNLRMAAGI